ncbi:S41 family peptidase [candidate division WWE3 bacterium]|nr:S41 family peptidase [candidate division WWE3 bacterium]
MKSGKLYIQLILSVLIFGGGYWVGVQKPGLIPGIGGSSRPEISVLNKEPQSQNKIQIDMSLFWEVLSLMEKNYLDIGDIKGDDLLYGAVNGMVAAAGDPYTSFFKPDDNVNFKDGLEGLYEGIGAQLGYNDAKALVVMAPLEGSPAEQAGIKAGDRILEVNGEDVSGWSIPKAVDAIRGDAGSEVTLTLYRDSGDNAGSPFELKVKREQIKLPAVRLTYVDNNQYAHLRVLRFGSETVSEWDTAVAELTKSNVKGVILDVRNNPGGYLNAAIHLGSEFFKDGVVVKRRGVDGVEEFKVDHPCKLCDIPVVVLINKGSASASEILAGSIQTRGRGRLIGEKSFGKGTVQEAIELRDGTSLHVTTARWLMPNDQNIHKVGLTPDIEVSTENASGPFGDGSDDAQLQKAIESFR